MAWFPHTSRPRLPVTHSSAPYVQVTSAPTFEFSAPSQLNAPPQLANFRSRKCLLGWWAWSCGSCTPSTGRAQESDPRTPQDGSPGPCLSSSGVAQRPLSPLNPAHRRLSNSNSHQPTVSPRRPRVAIGAAPRSCRRRLATPRAQHFWCGSAETALARSREAGFRAPAPRRAVSRDKLTGGPPQTAQQRI